MNGLFVIINRPLIVEKQAVIKTQGLCTTLPDKTTFLLK